MIGFGSQTLSHLSTTQDAVKYKQAHEMMARPSLSLTVKLSNGDIISYAEVGEKTGFPVIWFSGPTTNRFLIALYDELARDNGLRLLCFDRPGRGASTPCRYMKHWEFRSWGPLMYEITDKLGLDKFFVIGQSIGCSYAMASFPFLEHKIVGALRFLGTWAPSNLPCMPTSYALQRSLPTRLIRSTLSLGASSLVANMSETIPCQMGVIGYRERDTTTDQYVYEILDRVGQDARSDAYKAYELDWLLALEVKKPFGFDHRRISCAIRCWHGMDDNISPLGAAMWMQREMKNFLLYAVEGATHNIYLDFSIMKAVFADIQQEAIQLGYIAAPPSPVTPTVDDIAPVDQTQEEESSSQPNQSEEESTSAPAPSAEKNTDSKNDTVMSPGTPEHSKPEISSNVTPSSDNVWAS